jgi:prepilin-type N-terminal cleavage/methylation domain-containing protein
MIRRPSRGFSLVELAVVLVIVALLLGGMLMPLAGQQDMHSRRETTKALAVIQESLIGFALSNGRLPCPAVATLPAASGGACPDGGAAGSAGCEATTGAGAMLACATVAGVLPWATLGLAETDAWGNRYSYRVTAAYAHGIDPARTAFGSGCTLNPANRASYDAALGDGPRQSAFALCSPGDIAVLTAAGGAVAARDLPAIVVSHGRNGAGAFTVQGTRIANPASADEAENADDNASFVSSTAADDLLQWIPRGLLMNRMLAAGKLP